MTRVLPSEWGWLLLAAAAVVCGSPIVAVFVAILILSLLGILAT